MDVQGSQYHLLHGEADWARCLDALLGLPLAVPWAAEAAGDPSPVSTLDHDDDLQVLRLHRDTPLFRRAARRPPLDVAGRRGAGRDGYGNWFWIGADNASIRWLPVAGGGASTWWTPGSAADGGPATGDFAACGPDAASTVQLAGLAVTTGHDLLVGYENGDESGLLVFDLQAGGAPVTMCWPDGVEFSPFDIADTPDGGALVLDTAHAQYWRLDAQLRLRGTGQSTPTTFQPVHGPPALIVTTSPVATELLSAPGDAWAIEPGPDGSALILDSDPGRGYSLIDCYDDVAGRQWSASLEDAVEVIDPADPTETPHTYSVLGLDIVYAPAGTSIGPLSVPMLYIADAEGYQVLAFRIEPDGLVAQPDFLPMRRWSGRALVRTPEGSYYDLGERWIPLEVFTECRFEQTGVVRTAIDFADQPAGAPFDSRIAGCVWHRVLLDAQIPNGCAVTIRARANDDPELLASTAWLPQPVPYLRSGGPELPWDDVWADRRDAAGALPDGTGTWELLLQQVTGRYAQLEITLYGNGRSTPLIRSVRTWYPRFSYPEHYLPAVYVQEDAASRFLERFLANPEGLFLGIEEAIEHTHLLLDARTTPAPDLPWLACWFGLALDPLWDEAKRRFLIQHVDEFYRRRGTVPGVVAALRVYLDATLDDSVFCGNDLGSVRLVERFRTRNPSPPELESTVAGAAHRFDVLVPADLDDGTLQMVSRIVENAKPAHTWFDVQQYSDLFRVGLARVGLDTQLGHGPSFVPLRVGAHALAESYLAYPRPFDLADRVVLDRDRVGGLPAL